MFNFKNKANKYKAKRITSPDGITFHSKAEYARWLQLVALERTGAISNLRRQVRYKLAANGKHICAYIADHVYVENGQEVVEDVKGFMTQLAKLKLKMMDALLNIQVKVVKCK